jgi:fatty-acyl-CoA synthase
MTDFTFTALTPTAFLERVGLIFCDRGEGVTHFSVAPTVLTMVANAPEAHAGPPPDRIVRVQTGGAPPTPTLLARMADLRMDVTHLYGLSETYGPIAINEWQP